MAASRIEFHRISGEYDKGRISEDIAFWAQEARKIGGLTESSLVVDMGCGTGNYGIGIKDVVGCTVVGFDPVLGMLRQAIEKDLGFPVVRAVS
jgi:ubiquinone/menaquinone biosynthesis C-methylase UbiE